jgi:hypothetical protein
MMAILRNLAISILHLTGIKNTANGQKQIDTDPILQIYANPLLLPIKTLTLPCNRTNVSCIESRKYDKVVNINPFYGCVI